ncbi:MAG: hypothetical protein GOMPHAMPRED_008327 [Gomphillus americanus]|uniref:Uncharacterized protein n=1 Tax=Gomphillus americanus TaxID=1940652 RepID=A0A8H3F0S2_9LECA|nr:MAG: hypothetical protein GOMPHAMPRED_008327 [Gomphillus americanus]
MPDEVNAQDIKARLSQRNNIDYLSGLQEQTFDMRSFEDQSTTIEDILKEKGENVRHGTLGTEGDIEIWDDVTISGRTSMEDSGEKARI